LKDAQFSRLDLVTCRNLLIYLNRDAQTRAFDIFHFALKPDGLMFVGMSETIDEGSTQFTVVDKKHRLYQRKTDSRQGLPILANPIGPLARQIQQDYAHELARLSPAAIT
jgi:two-component system CheB/CheR fusion protein